MAMITDRDELVNHLSKAISERKRWIFLTDSRQGHHAIAGLAMAIITLTPDGDEMFCGLLDWWNVPTHDQATISFLTVPKERLSLKDVQEWCKQLGTVIPTQKQDLICLSNTMNDEMMHTFLVSMQKRKIIGEG